MTWFQNQRFFMATIGLIEGRLSVRLGQALGVSRLSASEGKVRHVQIMPQLVI